MAGDIGDACSWLMENGIEPLWEGIKTAGASIVNLSSAFNKGLDKFSNGLWNFFELTGTVVATPFTAAYDLLTGQFFDNKEGSTTSELWKGTMSNVAKEDEKVYLEDVLDDYTANLLDEHAIEIAKSDGILSNFFTEIGYQAPMIMTPVLSVMAGTGRYTEEKWTEDKNNSWVGMEEMYKKGEISKEQYESIKTIRNMTDEQWTEIENNYRNLNITKEEFETMKQIREMPEDWKTAENAIEGILYGVGSGSWDGLTWKLDKILSGLSLVNSEIGNSAIRVGIDTISNVADTPIRTGLTVATSDKTLSEAWEEQGGWSSVLINAGIGSLIGTTGEIIDFDYKHSNKNNITFDINNTDIDINNANINIKNTMDPEHGYQLKLEDMGDFYKTNLEKGFFKQEQIDNMLKIINSKGYTDEITGEYLKKLFSGDSDIYIKTINSADLDSIMDEGIRCLGNSTSGKNAAPTNIKNIDLDDTVTKVTNGGLYDLLARLKTANGISQGMNITDGAIIIKIPKGASLEDILKFNPELGIYNIDPKYNIGFIGADKNGVLDGSQLKSSNIDKVKNSLKQDGLFGNYDNYIVNKVKKILEDKQMVGEIDVTKMTKEELKNQIDIYSNDIANKFDNIMNSKELFSKYDPNTVKILKNYLKEEQLKENIDLTSMTETELKKFVDSNFNNLINKLNDVMTNKKLYNNLTDEEISIIQNKIYNDSIDGKLNIMQTSEDNLLKYIENQSTEIKQVLNTINDSNLYLEWDDYIVNKVKKILKDKYINGEIDITKISKEELVNEINDYSNDIVEKFDNIINNDNLFSNFENPEIVKILKNFLTNEQLKENIDLTNMSQSQLKKYIDSQFAEIVENINNIQAYKKLYTKLTDVETEIMQGKMLADYANKKVDLMEFSEDDFMKYIEKETTNVRKFSEAINDNTLYEGMDNYIVKKVKKILQENYLNKDIDITKITKEELKSQIDNYAVKIESDLLNIFNIVTMQFEPKDAKIVKKCLEKAQLNEKIDLTSLSETKLQNYLRNYENITEKIDNVLKDKKLFSKLDKKTAKNIKEQLYNDFINGELDVTKITYSELQQYINLKSKNLTEIKNQLNNLIKNNYQKVGEIDEFFENNSKYNNRYGVDQGGLDELYLYETPEGNYISGKSPEYEEYRKNGIRLKEVKLEEYKTLKDFLVDNYNISNRDATKVISALDSRGACSYAATANEIINIFRNNPQLYEEIFGFPLYNLDGSLNANMLLCDIYAFCNHSDNGGRLIIRDEMTGENFISSSIGTDINNKSVWIKDEQKYLSFGQIGKNVYEINAYLKSKMPFLEYSSSTDFFETIDNANLIKTIDKVQNEMSKGTALSMGISVSKSGKIRFIDTDTRELITTTWKWNENGGHAVHITGIEEDGFIVSTWGRRCLIPFEDLIKAGNFEITYSNIKVK